MAQVKNKQFYRLRNLALAAFICTLIAVIVCLSLSLIPGEESAKQSAAIKDFIKKYFNVDDTVVPKIFEYDNGYLNSQYYYSGDKLKIKISSTPADAASQCVYDFGKYADQFVVGDDGSVTFVGTAYANVDVRVTSAIDPEVSCNFIVCVRGLSPADSRIQSLHIGFKESESSTTIIPADKVDVHKTYFVQLYAVIKPEYLQDFGLTADNNTINLRGTPTKFGVDGDSATIWSDGYNRKVRFTKPYEGNLNIRFSYNENKYFDQVDGNANVKLSAPVKATINPNINYVPTKPLVPVSDNGQIVGSNGNYTLTLSDDNIAVNLQAQKQGDAIVDFKLVADNSSQKGLSISGTRLHRQANQHTTVIWMVSIIDPNVKTKITVVQLPSVPTKLDVGGEANISIAEPTTQLKAKHNTNVYEQGGVTWSIVDGAEIATISQNGKLTAKTIGKVTVRATSVAYPELYGDFTVTVAFWTSFASFIRKSIGHFLMFAVIGFGFTATYFLMVRSRLWVVISAPVSVAFTAMTSEFLQMPMFVQGRGPSAIDVILDCLGGFCGVAFGLALIVAIGFVWFVISPKSFKKLRKDLAMVNYQTAFSRKACKRALGKR